MRTEHPYFNAVTGDYFVSIGREVEREGYVAVPPRPGPGHVFDPQSSTWSPDPDYVEPVFFANLSARQLRLMLLSIGITPAMVDAEIAAIADETERAAAEIEWEYASSYERTHPLIDQMAAAFELPPEQVDTLWLAAADL